MENAPTPAKKSKEYKLVSDCKTFIVKLSFSTSILIEINEADKIWMCIMKKAFL